MSRPSRKGTLSSLFQSWPLQHIAPDKLISEQGIVPQHIHVLEEGMVAFYVRDYGGKEIIVATRSSPWIVGATSYFLKTPNMAAAIAMTHSQVRSIPVEAFGQILKTNSEALWWLCELFSREVSMLATHAAGLAAHSVRERLEEYLFFLSANSPDRACRVYFPFTQERVARFLSTHPGYLSASLRELEVEGLIRRDENGIVIPDRTKLWHRDLLHSGDI